MKPNTPCFDASYRKECSVQRVPRGVVDHMIAAHYIGKWPGVVVLTLALKHKGRFVGVVVYALPPRETAKRYGGETWELARLWVADEMPTNTETFLISKSVKWIKKNCPLTKFLVSYADPSAGHAGTIYKAANWKPDGRTDDERKTPRFDYADAKTGKRYSRRGHVPFGTELVRIPRVSKHRFVLGLL